jgi:membrane-associated phospholipid phosphatase
MATRFVRLAVAAGVLAALAAVSTTYAADRNGGIGDDLNRAIASAEDRGRAAQLAEPAYPSQPPPPARQYRYIGNGQPYTVRISPLLLAQADSRAAGGAAVPERLAPADLAADKQYEPPTFSIKEDLKNTPRWLWEDTKRVYTSPLNLALLMTAGGASIAVHQHVDWTFNDKFEQSRTCKRGWGDAANVAGYPPLHLAIAGAWYLAGYELKDLKTYNVGKNLLSALIITDLSTVGLKICATDTEGPRGQHFSWPSGHTSSTFAMAAVLDEAYGHVVGVPMYAMAGWVGFERMDDHQHMFSDVLFGGVLGLVIGHSVASGHLPQIAGGTLVPYADPVENSAGFAWIKSTK